MWIMLIKKLPTKPSPPKLSIFWSEPWPHMEYAKRSKEEQRESEDIGMSALFGNDPDFANARKINYCGTDLRVFPHEFSVMKADNMRLYILGIDGVPNSKSHELIVTSHADKKLVQRALEPDQNLIYDAALIDGCTHEQALMTALEMDITDAALEFAPLGWYRCLPHYAQIYCEDWEMVEDEETEAEYLKAHPLIGQSDRGADSTSKRKKKRARRVQHGWSADIFLRGTGRRTY